MRRSTASVWNLVVTSLVWLCTGLVSPAQAQVPTGGHDPIAAGEDAYRYHEQMRLGNIRTQLGLIDQLTWYRALPAINGAVSGSGYNVPGAYNRDPPSLNYVYATGRRSAYGYGDWGRGLTPLYGGGYSRDIFSPWPYVPGDIYGYQWYDPAPQSLGQRQIQTGPNRWESHPVYATDLSAGETDYYPAVRRELVRAEPIRKEPHESPRRRPREF